MYTHIYIYIHTHTCIYVICKLRKPKFQLRSHCTWSDRGTWVAFIVIMPWSIGDIACIRSSTLSSWTEALGSCSHMPEKRDRGFGVYPSGIALKRLKDILHPIPARRSLECRAGGAAQFACAGRCSCIFFRGPAVLSCASGVGFG